MTFIKEYDIIAIMKKSTKAIRFSEHAKDQLVFRGATKEEIIETIKTSDWNPAELGRVECRKEFAFN